MAKEKNNWHAKLERKWVAPAYSAGVLIAIGLSFFGAATNTMSGWLYVLSGTIFAILFVGAILPIRAIKELSIRRSPIVPVSVGEVMQVQVQFTNDGKAAKTLVAATDKIPEALGAPHRKVIEMLPPKESLDWVYELDANKRGIFYWDEMELRTANPLGLFWCRRSHSVTGRAVVYPQILPLKSCPIIDSIGADESTKFQSDRLYQNAHEGLTKTIRNYRSGDPMRLIHWRSSARFGEFKVRELEVTTGGEEVIICLDHVFDWEAESFEQAVSAAASLYFYARRAQINVKFWTAQTGIINSKPILLDALAGIQPTTTLENPSPIPKSVLLWLTQNPLTIEGLVGSGRWIFFAPEDGDQYQSVSCGGLTVNAVDPLQMQLQKSVLSQTT